MEPTLLFLGRLLVTVLSQFIYVFRLETSLVPLVFCASRNYYFMIFWLNLSTDINKKYKYYINKNQFGRKELIEKYLPC